MKKDQKGAMARRLVIYCISVLTAAFLWAAFLKTYCALHSLEVDLSDVLVFVGAAFGGELLLLLLKRVFAKPNKESEELNDE